MSLLDTKLRRDLLGLKSQALAVALVMACGLTMMVMTRSLILTLENTRDTYYRDYRFAELFVRLKRAPDAVAQDLAAIRGIAAVQTSIALSGRLEITGVPEPATGLFISLPEQGEPVLDRLFLRKGHMLTGRATPGDVLVGEAFSEAHGLQPGDTLAAVLYGRRQTLRIAGIVLSPEFVFEAPPGSALPDNRSYGIFWLPYKELATAANMDGAFNQATFTLAPGARADAVAAEIDRMLRPYGGRGTCDRESHPSHTRLRDEIRVLHGLSVGFPLVFLGVAAFMTNAVMSRQITLQREQIAILKAFGFTNREIGGHYLKFALVIVLIGTALGILGGIGLGHKLVVMYHLFFRFPHLDFQLARGVLVAAAAVSSLAAIAGVGG
ncbi:MAG: ABC transporter permease, partial [Cephaloticoccus sp.]